MKQISIIQGQQAVLSEEGVTISTLLGSCIAVCLHDAHVHVGGMNHFLLGEPDPAHAVRPEDRSCYGVHAMELLINAMKQHGAAHGRMRAHVYGGANIVAALGSIGTTNGEFALRFLKGERIPVGHCDIGGTLPRKVEFRPWDGMARSYSLAHAPDPPPSSICTLDRWKQGEEWPEKSRQGGADFSP
jgi:chemotaxis protein CheD